MKNAARDLRYRCDCAMASAKASSYAESLRDYLHGDEWRENVDIFIRSNCGQFRSDLRSSSDDYERSHKYYALWKTFQEIVESILEVALLTIGGSTTALEKALDDVARTKTRGPRAEAIADIAERLLCYTDYHAFIEMMGHAAQESMDTNYSAQSAQRHHTMNMNLTGEVTDRGLPVAHALAIPMHPRAAAAARYNHDSYQQAHDADFHDQHQHQHQHPYSGGRQGAVESCDSLGAEGAKTTGPAAAATATATGTATGTGTGTGHGQRGRSVGGGIARSYRHHRQSLELMGFSPDLVDSVLPEQVRESLTQSLPSFPLSFFLSRI